MTTRSAFAQPAIRVAAISAGIACGAALAPAFGQSINDPRGSNPDDGFRPVWQQQQGQGKQQKKQPEKPSNAAKSKAAPAIAVETVSTLHENWLLSCTRPKTANSKQTCSGTLRIADAKSGKIVLRWDIGRGGQGDLLAQIQTPTGVQLVSGLEMQVEGQTTHKYEYASCTEDNCEATGPVDEALLRKLNATPEVIFLMRGRDGREIRIKTPLAGLDKVLSAVRS